MMIRPLLASITAWGLLFTAGSPAAEPAAVPHVSLKVTADRASDYKGIPGSSEHLKTQRCQLVIDLENHDQAAMPNLSVKWTIYARKMDNGKLMVVKQGTVKTKVDALGSVHVKSDKAMMKGNSKYTVTNVSWVRGQRRVSHKNHPPAGEEYYGYAVQVFSGSALIDETYSLPSLKKPQ